jgi:hypothetical protein
MIPRKKDADAAMHRNRGRNQNAPEISVRRDRTFGSSRDAIWLICGKITGITWENCCIF